MASKETSKELAWCLNYSYVQAVLQIFSSHYCCTTEWLGGALYFQCCANSSTFLSLLVLQTWFPMASFLILIGAKLKNFHLIISHSIFYSHKVHFTKLFPVVTSLFPPTHLCYPKEGFLKEPVLEVKSKLGTLTISGSHFHSNAASLDGQLQMETRV